MKIVQCLHAQGGGHWRYVRELAQGLSILADTVILCPVQSAEEVLAVRCVFGLSAIDPTASGVQRLANRLRVYWAHPGELARVLDAEREMNQPNVVHFQQLPTFRAKRMLQVARARGYTTAITVHNLEPHSFGLMNRIRQRLGIRAWAAADVLIVHSSRLREKLLRLIPGAVVCVVPHPIWREPINRGIDERDFLFFGVLRESKGIDNFIEALALLNNPTASIIGAGSMDMVTHIREQLIARGLTQCEFNPGFLPEEDIAAVFGSHSVVVAPYTHFEAQSGVTHLALAHRRPVVVTDFGGLGDPVRQFGVGEVVRSDPQSIANGMAIVRSRAPGGCYESGFDQAELSLGVDSVARATLACYSLPIAGACAPEG